MVIGILLGEKVQGCHSSRSSAHFCPVICGVSIPCKQGPQGLHITIYVHSQPAWHEPAALQPELTLQGFGAAPSISIKALGLPIATRGLGIAGVTSPNAL